MWTQLILIWLALNLVLVLLLWWRSSRPGAQASPPTQPPATARFEGGALHASAPAASPAGATSRRPPRVLAPDEHRSERFARSLPVTPCPGYRSEEGLSACRLRELQAEIRELKLTVAELSLDKARLSSAIARQRC